MNGFEILESQSFADELGDQLNKLKEKDVRIILGNFNEYWARKIFCEAYKKEMFGKNYQWIITGRRSDAVSILHAIKLSLLFQIYECLC